MTKPITNTSRFIRSTTALLACSALLFTTACQTNMSGDVVTSQSSAGKVAYGTVVSSRQVTIKESKKITDNTLGGATGAVAGGVAGSAFGKGKGSTLAAVGVGVAGAVLGALIQDALSTSTGQEYIVKLETSSTGKKTAKTKKVKISKGNSSIQSELADANSPVEVESDAISVIQTDAQPIANGTRVMVVYRDDGVRISPAF